MSTGPLLRVTLRSTCSYFVHARPYQTQGIMSELFAVLAQVRIESAACLFPCGCCCAMFAFHFSWSLSCSREFRLKTLDHCSGFGTCLYRLSILRHQLETFVLHPRGLQLSSWTATFAIDHPHHSPIDSRWCANKTVFESLNCCGRPSESYSSSSVGPG